ncbi:MAG: hypothetical protein J7L82_01010 [Staphylothermus sp.]|nr:hypothetical protein [Staphylothermus sp.]
MHKGVFILLSMIILTSLLGNIIANNNNNHIIPLPDKDLLRTFLENQYVPEIGLLRASPYEENTTIYVANDNVLAARALEVLGSPLATKVLTVLNNNFSGGWNGKIDILLGRDIPDMFYSMTHKPITEINGYKIMYEIPDLTTTINDWYNYADLIVYRALDKLLLGSRPHAEQLFINLTKLWDGYGFYDNPAEDYKEDIGNITYETYKCALFIYLYRALQYAGSEVIYNYTHIYEKCHEIIAMAQDPVKGGVYTHYTAENGTIVILKGPGRDMNTETTSIVVLAIYSDYPMIIAYHDC